MGLSIVTSLLSARPGHVWRVSHCASSRTRQRWLVRHDICSSPFCRSLGIGGDTVGPLLIRLDATVVRSSQPRAVMWGVCHRIRGVGSHPCQGSYSSGTPSHSPRQLLVFHRHWLKSLGTLRRRRPRVVRVPKVTSSQDRQTYGQSQQVDVHRDLLVLF